MSGLPWNSPGPFVCHCDECDAPPDPACCICGNDGIEIDMRGTCAECAPHGEETTAEWEERVEKRRKR